MFAVCSICVCVCILPCRLFCFVLFLVVLCSQFAYLSADLLIISKYTQHTRLCILCNVQCIPANKIKSRNYSRRSPAICKPKRCSFSGRSNKGKNCSPHLSALIQTPHLNAVCLLAASCILNLCFRFFCLFFSFSHSNNKLSTPFSDSQLIAFMRYLFIVMTRHSTALHRMSMPSSKYRENAFPKKSMKE